MLKNLNLLRYISITIYNNSGVKKFFVLGKRRRKEENFPGSSIILKQLSEKPSRRRVGFLSSGPPARGERLTSFQHSRLVFWLNSMNYSVNKINCTFILVLIVCLLLSLAVVIS